MALKHTSLFQEASQCAMMVWEKENIRITSLSFTHVGVESWELPWNVTIGKAITQRTSFENPVVWIWILSPPLLGIEKWANSFMSLCLGFFTCKMGIIISSSWSCHVSKELTHVNHSVKVKWKCWSLSCVQLCNPMDYSLPGSSVHGILQEEYWSGLPFPSPRDLQGSNPGLPHCRQILYGLRHQRSLTDSKHLVAGKILIISSPHHHPVDTHICYSVTKLSEDKKAPTEWRKKTNRGLIRPLT